MNTKIYILIMIPILTTAILLLIFYQNPSFIVLDSNSEIILAISDFGMSIDNERNIIPRATGSKIWIIHPDEEWKIEEIFNENSLVVHKGLVFDVDGDFENEILGIYGYNSTANIFKKMNESWEKFDLLDPNCTTVRDVEFGDVDGDFENELVFGTHAPGMVIVLDNLSGLNNPKIIDLSEDEIIHEIEIIDFDSDGVEEIFATISEPNKIGAQSGAIVEYDWNGEDYDKILLDKNNITHAKEIIVGDVDNNGLEDLVAIFNCVPDGISIQIPIQIKKYEINDGLINTENIFNISSEYPIACFFSGRHSDIGDVNNDGIKDLVIGTHSTGIHIISFINGSWEDLRVDIDPFGGMRALKIIDINNDGINEIISSSYGASVVKIHYWNELNFVTENLFSLPRGDIIWGIDWGDVDNK